MFLSDLSIRRPVFAAVIMLTLVTLGVFSYRRLGLDFFPNVEIPVVMITTTYPGASPETVEREVSKRIDTSRRLPRAPRSGSSRRSTRSPASSTSPRPRSRGSRS